MNRTEPGTADLNEGLAVGGPADGKRMCAATMRITVPVPGPGGFGQAIYEFEFGMWICWQDGTNGR